MLTFEVIIVFLGLIGMVTALLLDKMRPGMILFSVTVFFLCFGILTPKEMLEGFLSKKSRNKEVNKTFIPILEMEYKKLKK